MTPHPPLKWPGGKRKLAPLLASKLPEKIRAYHEPFFGGGALFWHMAAEKRFEKAAISDVNAELAGTMLALKKYPKTVLELLDEDARNHSEDRFLLVRSMTGLGEPSAIAARMLYLNRACFNGLYRVNKRGQFNVPIGRKPSGELYAPEDILNDQIRYNIMACSKALQDTVIMLSDYASSLAAEAVPGDAVYLDPPYVPASKTANFTAYSSGGFTHDDQIKLELFARRLRDRGVCVLLSNSEAARQIYEPHGWKIHSIKVQRNISCKANRAKAGEILIGGV